MEILEHLHWHLAAFGKEILRLGVWFLLLMAVFAPLEKLFAVSPQKIFRKSFWADTGYYFLSGLVPGALLALPTAALAWCIHGLMPGRFLAWSGGLPLGARLLGALVAGEFGYYWAHRWMHEIPFLWRFHAIHHSAEEIDWLVSTRVHPVDMIFSRLVSFVPMYALGLAQPMAGHTADMVPYLFMLIGLLWGYFIHANLRWRFGWLSVLISTPAFHHWHHTRNQHTNKNYASMLPIFDCIFGTWYMPARQWPSQYGIDGAMAPGMAGQLAQPFLPHTEQPPLP